MGASPMPRQGIPVGEGRRIWINLSLCFGAALVKHQAHVRQQPANADSRRHFRVTVTVAVPNLVGSATLIAFTVTVFVDEGAVYTPVALIVPTVEFPPVTLFTCQVTFVLVVFSTVA